MARVLTSIASMLTRRGAFSSQPAQEAPKFALIRILFGLFMLERAFWILAYLEPSDWHLAKVWVVAVAAFISATMIVLGLFTQVAFVFLVVFQWQAGDHLMSTLTLGNYIAAILSILLLFANAGAHFSFDHKLMKSGRFVGKVVSLFYYSGGLPSEAGLQIAKLMALASYWFVCLYSLGMHLTEPAWLTGSAGPQLLTNNFMSRYSSEFAWIFSFSSVPVFLARISLWAMLPWYLCLLPFVIIGGWFRQYVIIWSVLFFGLSLFVLQLGWLAQFEYLMFAGIFWSKTFIAGPKSLQVAYDDRCNLCDRTVRFVKGVDLFNRVELKPLSQNSEWLLRHGIDPTDAQKDLYAVDTGRGNLAAKGYEFYILLSRHVVLLLPLLPVLIVGKYLGGPAIYRFIGARRTKLFGVCQVPTVKPEYVIVPSGDFSSAVVKRDDPILPVSMHLAILLLFYLLAIPPVQAWIETPRNAARMAGLLESFSGAAWIYGVGTINVFNQTDLRMGENWFTISKKGPDNIESLLPIFSEDGTRLAAHRSDRIYFGNTVRFRRAVIGQEGCQFDAFRSMFDYLVENDRKGGETFVYRQYREPLPSAQLLLRGQYVASERRLVCEVTY